MSQTYMTYADLKISLKCLAKVLWKYGILQYIDDSSQHEFEVSVCEHKFVSGWQLINTF